MIIFYEMSWSRGNYPKALAVDNLIKILRAANNKALRLYKTLIIIRRLYMLDYLESD